MRLILALATATLLAAADPPAAPPPTQKLVDSSVEIVQKAHDAYLAALRKEQDKLLAAMQREQDKATKKGDLEAALAIKAQIDDVQSGLLQREAETAKDLLGNASPPQALPTSQPAGLSTDCTLKPESTPVTGGPKTLEAMLNRCSHIEFPKGDRTHYIFTCISGGLVAVSTGAGQRPHAELWQELAKAGFKRVDDPAVREAWWVMDARSGQRVTVFDPNQAAATTAIYANRFVPAR